MSTFQQTKPKTVTKTTTTTSVTCEQSQKLVQTMLTMSFGCLAFLRGFFPDDNFADQRFVPEKVSKDYNKDRNGAQANSIKIKTLVRGKSLEVDLFLDWLEKGVFKSIKLKYLKGLSLGVFADENAPTDLIEDYVFGFSYDNDGQVLLTVNGDEGAVSLLESRKVVQQLMRRFIIITQSLEPLPEKRFLSMRLLFNENAPLDYQPQLFKDVSRERPATVQVPISTDLDTYSVGSLDTKFHKVALKVLSIVESEEVKEGATRKVDPFSLIDTTDSPQDTYSRASQNTSDTLHGPSQTSRYLQNLLSSPSIGVTQTQHLSEDTEFDCQCGTSCPQATTKTLTCSTCKRKLHKICYGNLSQNFVHECISCLNRSGRLDLTTVTFKVLMMLRKIYRFMVKKRRLPTKVSEFYAALAGPKADSASIDNINLALSIMFSDEVFVLEKERRKQARSSSFLSSSDYIDIDHNGIVVKGVGEIPINTKVVWTFVANSVNAQVAYTSVVFENFESLESALQSVGNSLATIPDIKNLSAEAFIVDDSPGSSLDFYSLRIDDDTQNTLETGKRKHPGLTSYLETDRTNLDDTLDAHNFNSNKIRKISASKKTLRSIW
ncbi:LAME_0F13256g1_1 [Lachancea meyersii CBS 8951]|uniref:LAME_0F13256g1_1 n=1 Tax=Lachancea meyersii CBS 8951 TaxID=1266667 RepID=A0A1G4JXG5_9SACH|nr:LAME_0F13256g1_1 [Lachancea meyersii CBS 8951]